MLTPGSGFDPQISLATSVHAQPGVYALLLGSGVSTGSGIPTGWGVIRELVIRASAAKGSGLTLDSSDDEIEEWWNEHGDGEPLGYSNLLEVLARTSAARQALLAGFFEPTEEEREDGLKVPGPAHEAIADLVARGYVRVIVTTNFDRLTERALEARGVSPQVISSPQEITAMAPLAHARCTVIKLHGDYASLEQRNTVDELSTYPAEQNDLLARIFDEYGLIVSGWSADWDRALVAAMQASASRRYPWYWGQMGTLSNGARNLVRLKGATLIDGMSAEALFGGLAMSLDAIESLATAPASATIAVAQMKRMLPNPIRRLEMRDIFERELRRVGAVTLAQSAIVEPDLTPEIAQAVFDDLRAVTDTLLHLYFNGVYLDRDREHTDMWVWVIDRAMHLYRQPFGTFYPWRREAQHYPALLLLQAGFMAALLAQHEDVLVQLATTPTWRNPLLPRDAAPAFSVLDPRGVIRADVANALPRWEGTRYELPQAHLIAEDLRPVATDAAGGSEAYDVLANDAQYRLAIATTVLPGGRGGTFIGTYAYEPSGGFGTYAAEDRFRRSGNPVPWGWSDTSDGSDFDETLKRIRDSVSRSGLGW